MSTTSKAARLIQRPVFLLRPLWRAVHAGIDGPTRQRVDSRRDYGEVRRVALGKAQDILLAVVDTDRAEVGAETERRIISARKSSRRERETYEKATRAK